MDRPVRVFGVPMDLGADRRGVDMGPSAIRYAGLADAVAKVREALAAFGPSVGRFLARLEVIHRTLSTTGTDPVTA